MPDSSVPNTAPSRGPEWDVLTVAQWRTQEAEHRTRAQRHTAGHLARRHEQRKHPIEDFLFVYYDFSPGKLSRYSPGPGIALQCDEHQRSPMTGMKFVRRVSTHLGPADVVDVEAFLTARARTIDWVRMLVSATKDRPAHHACFGLHEWAMVYGLKPGEKRHEQLPLRLGQEATDAVVEASDIRCTHFDAFRFFTPPAVPRNAHQLSRDDQLAFEQPGCLHAGMDLYKWAYRLWPYVPSALVLDAFELAKDIRTLDMEASPYDVRGLGYGVVPVETPAGRAEYVRRQREFAQRSQELRGRLLAALPPSDVTG